MVEIPISRVEWDVVPGTALAAGPVEGVMALGGDRVGLDLLLGGQMAVDLAVGAEVAARRCGQEPLLVPAQGGRGDELVEARVARRQLDPVAGLQPGRAGPPVPQSRGIALEEDLLRLA